MSDGGDAVRDPQWGLPVTVPDGMDESRWAIYARASIPELDTVLNQVLELSHSHSAVIDSNAVMSAVDIAVWERLRELTATRTDITFDNLCEFRTKDGFDHSRLSAYLVARGAIGIALADKLSAYLAHVLPQQIAQSVRAGMYDQ